LALPGPKPPNTQTLPLKGDVLPKVAHF